MWKMLTKYFITLQEQKQVAQSDSGDLKSIFYQFKEKQAESNNNASYSNSLFFEWDLNV